MAWKTCKAAETVIQHSAHLRIETAGPHAPWLTLVHGATQNRAVFSAQVAAFRHSYRLLLIDLLGHGESAGLEGPFGPIEYAQGVIGAMDAAGVTRTHYWGTHTGTAVALLLGQRLPERFISFVLEGAVIPGRQLHSIVTCYERARQTMHEHGLRAAKQEWFARSPWFDVIREHPVECRAAEHQALINTFSGAPWQDLRTPQAALMTSDDLTRMTVPTLLVNGEHEVSDFLPIVDELQATLRHASRVVVPGAGGFPLWEFPDQVNALVHNYLLSTA
jgi:3-oxoadipate enol-lactonase